MAEPEDEVPSLLLPCTICNRTFKPETLEKHSKICEKNASKKRKTFDSSKQRIHGTELAEFLPVIPKKEKSPVKKPQSLWKQKHLEFVRAIRQARGVEVPGKRTLSAVEQSRPAIHDKCPHCERNFGPKAFDRHIEWCKEQKTRIPKSPANTVAKERLEARTKYRAPLSKSKRSITREKYSPVMRGGGVREPSPMGSRSSVSVGNTSQTVAAAGMPSIRGTATRTSGSAPSSQRSSARESLSSPTCSMQRNTASRSSIQRPTKRPSLVKKDSVAGKGESPKKNSTNDLFSSSCNITRISPPGKSKAAVSVPVVNAARTKNRKNEVRSNRSPSPVNLPASPHEFRKKSISRVSVKKHNANPKQPIKSICSEGSQICAGIGEEQQQHTDVKPKLENNETCKMSLNKDKYLRKFNQLKKINSIDVNNDTDITVSSCNIYPSSRNMVTWQELAAGGADSSVETKLNQTYTVAEFENTDADVLKLDLPCSSPETELQARIPEDNDKRIEISLQNVCFLNNPENSYERNDLNNRENSSSHDLSNSSIANSSNHALESLYVEPNVNWECISNPENISSESADAVADDEGVDGDVSATESYILTGSDDNQEPTLIEEMKHDCMQSEDGDIWEIAAQDFIKEENFNDGLENNQSHSTPVKAETHDSVVSSENNEMNFDDSKMKKKNLMFNTIKNKLKLNMSSHLLRSKSKSWSQRYFLKEKWLAALREKRMVGNYVKKSMDDFLLGPKFPKRKKLQDCNMEWCCTLVTPFSFCAAENETPFMFKSAKEKQIKYGKLSKSEHSLEPDLNSNRQSESLSACNRKKKRPIRHRNKCNHYESVKIDNCVKLREEIGKCISADSLEQEENYTFSIKSEENNDINVTIEYFSCQNSESEISTKNNVSEERFNDMCSKNAPSLNSYSESDKKQITAVFNKSVENLEDTEFNRSKSLPVMKAKYVSGKSDSQKKSMFPTISKVPNRITDNQTILNLSKSIKREIDADGADCVISLQEINRHSFELQDCKLELQEKLVLPDINSCKRDIKAGKKRKEKSSFWEQQQSRCVQPRRSGIPVRAKKGVYSSNPNSKKLPPLICSSAHKRNRFPRFMKGTLAPSIPNVQLILNSSDVTSGEAYDPYVSAERQMMELLSGDWSQTLEEKKKPEKEQEKNVAEPENQIISSPSPPPKEFRTSPTSAFTVNPKADVALQPPRSDQNSPPSFDFEELIISGRNTSSISSPHNISLSAITSLYDENDGNLSNHKELMISLSSICSIPNFDLNFELDTNVNRKSNRAKYRKKLENAALALQQSVSRYHPGPVVTESQLEEDDDVLLASEIDDFFSNTLLSHSSPESKLASTSSFQNCEDSGFQRKNGAIVVHVEEEHDSQVNRRSIGSKVSGDSAYSSLNRKSPVADINSQTLERHTEVLLDADIRCLSSSGSESSLPPLCSTQVEGRRVKSPLLSSTPTPSLLSGVDHSSSPKMSKFCHECGSKYPVSLAKFCCECGVRRLFV